MHTPLEQPLTDTRHPAPEDSAVIAASLTDPERFRAIWNRHHRTIVRYVASRVGSAATEDLVAAVFVAAFEARIRFNRDRVGDDALPWLLGIATRQVSSQRTLERKWLAQVAAAARTPEPSRDLLDDHAGTLGLRGELGAALRQLPVRQRDALLLHVIGDLEYVDVAIALSVPVGTVRSRINRAKQTLQALLDQREIR